MRGWPAGAALVLIGAISTWALGLPIAVVIAILILIFGRRR